MVPLRLPAIALATAVTAFALAGCSGDDGDSATATTAPAADTQSAAPDDAYIVYRDSLGGVVARNLLTDESYQYPVDYTSEAVVSVACTAQGDRIAILKQPFDVTDRRLLVYGRDALAEPLALPAAVQGMDWSPDGERIVYAEFDGFANVHRVSVLDVASGESTELASGDGVAGSPSWSPDGATIAFAIQDVLGTMADVFVVPAEGGELRQVPSPGDLRYYDPEWTPDGNGLLVAAQDETSAQIYRLDPETGAREPLTSSTDIYKRQPEYAPDGEPIAYTGSLILPMVSRYAAGLHSVGIFLLDADGSNERALTADPRLNPGAQVDPYLDAFMLSWCRPGEWLDDAWGPYVEPTPP